MPQPEEHYLQKEISVKHQLGKDPVRDVSDFIERVNGYVQERGKPDQFCVYRGEPECYPTPCRPNLFRRGVLAENRFFEKNLFDAMRQNKLTGEKRYLDNAIDAQHGEFPSRLLDVSYNCLVALYFAVTPYYHAEENSLDREDGMVFLFFLDEIFSPSARNTNDNYRAIIDRKPAWCQEPLFQKNIKFIDHTKLNPRIIAQQGAFMLFQGDEAEELPKRMFCGIRIPKEAKPKLRSQLKNLFGIHTGTIYPEISNLVRELTHKSRQLNTQAFTCENELYYALAQLERELDFYLDYALTQQREARPEPDEEHPKNLCLDAGYTGSGEAVEQRNYIPHIRPRGEEKRELERNPDFRARRWGVEVTHSFFNRFRNYFPKRIREKQFLESMQKLHSIFKSLKMSLFKYWASSRQIMQWTFLFIHME